MVKIQNTGQDSVVTYRICYVASQVSWSVSVLKSPFHIPIWTNLEIFGNEIDNLLVAFNLSVFRTVTKVLRCCWCM